MIAGLGSGAGKTTVAAGIAGALRHRGLEVATFKAGPDFLDPHVLGSAAGSPTRNLDLWLVPPAQVRQDFARAAPRGRRGISVVEGVMGVLDGTTWGTSSWDIARLLGLPVVLVLDASASSETLAVQARGARELLGTSRLAGVIVNRAGRGWHSTTVRRAVEERAKVPVLGVLPWQPEAILPERNLGLKTPRTDPGAGLERRVQALADLVEAHVDLQGVLRIARTTRPLPRVRRGHDGDARGSASTSVVAVASDAAFCFVYPESLEALKRVGARVRRFSPLKGDRVPSGADALYLPGGYPELHGRQLARNEPLKRELRSWVRDGRPLLAECGGMMYLLERMTDLEGARHRMVGAFPGSTSLSPRLGGFGYVEARATRAGLLGPRGTTVRGHLYHHSAREAPRGYPWGLSLTRRAGGPLLHDGYVQGRVLASYLHVRLDTVPSLLRGLVEAT
ncbi:MAG: cobyrinate a,c-diamide synthase [Euryarchaeota archaeon]|nr:cobyrinate a,c-diamide synthase [Euryarchaeota archaeon]